jgi:undecaprenyl-diphosphatase
VAAQPAGRGVLLGLIQGPAELLPVSSSGHVEAARVLWGLEGDEVVLHAGSLAALVLGCRAEAFEILGRLSWRRVGMHLAAGAIPAAAGFALERHTRRLPVIGGLVAGAAILCAADLRRPSAAARSRWDAGPADGIWLGLAQAAALWPGVSRNGATLAMARFRGFAPEEANPLSREVGVPVTLGAVLLRRGGVTAGTLAAFASALAAMPLLRIVDRGGPLWPWAAERLGLALVLLRESRR